MLPVSIGNRSLGEKSRSMLKIPTMNTVARRSGAGTSALLCVLLAGCNLLPVSQRPAHAGNGIGSSEGGQAQLMYEVMVAELAGRRGMLDIATEGYFSASRKSTDPRVSERATRLAIWSRAWQQAEDAGTRWAELDPDNAEVRQLLAQVYLRQGESQSAAEQLAHLIGMSEAQDNLREVMQNIFSLLVREPNRTVAIAAMTELRDQYEDDSHANLALAQLAYNAKDRELAADSVNRAIALDPGNGEAHLLRAQILSANGEVDQGFEELAKAVEADAENLDLRLGYARLMVESGRYKQAAVELETVFELGQDNAGAMFTIGLLALESKRTEPAEKYFNRLLDLGEYTNEAHFYLASIADDRRDHDEAIEHYESVSAGDSFLNAQIRAAELYGLTGQVELGRERLQQLAMENPDPEIKPQLIRAEGRILVEAGESAEAVKVLTQGVESYPEDTQLLYSRALASERAGDTETFIRDLEQMIELEPDHAHAMNALGYHYADNNINLEEAEVYLEKASALLPQDAAIMDSLGWLRYRTGELEEAIDLLEQAYKILPDPEIAAHLGEVLWVSGEQESARQVWDRALEDTPDHEALLRVVKQFVQ